MGHEVGYNACNIAADGQPREPLDGSGSSPHRLGSLDGDSKSSEDAVLEGLVWKRVNTSDCHKKRLAEQKSFTLQLCIQILEGGAAFLTVWQEACLMWFYGRRVFFLCSWSLSKPVVFSVVLWETRDQLWVLYFYKSCDKTRCDNFIHGLILFLFNPQTEFYKMGVSGQFGFCTGVFLWKSMRTSEVVYCNLAHVCCPSRRNW